MFQIFEIFWGGTQVQMHNSFIFHVHLWHTVWSCFYALFLRHLCFDCDLLCEERCGVSCLGHHIGMRRDAEPVPWGGIPADFYLDFCVFIHFSMHLYLSSLAEDSSPYLGLWGGHVDEVVLISGFYWTSYVFINSLAWVQRFWSFIEIFFLKSLSAMN